MPTTEVLDGPLNAPVPALVAKPMHNQWYVAVDGSRKEDGGSIERPWSLEYAGSGAGGRIVAGDTVWVRGGTYYAEQGWKVTVSGAPTRPITFKPYVDPATCIQEAVVLDGSKAEFRTAGNASWVPHETRPGHNVYRSAVSYPAPRFAFYSAFLQVDGDWYSLCALDNSILYVTSDQHNWDYPNPRYLGPSNCQDQVKDSPTFGHLFIRLDNSTPEAQLGRNVTQIDDPDPRQHALFIGQSERFGLRVEGSHLVIEDLAIHNFYGCYKTSGPVGQTDVTFRRAGGRTHYFGIRAGRIDGLTLDSCEWRGHMSPESWWVAWQDIKGGETPADHSRKCAIDLGDASNVEVVNCLVDQFVDGILARTVHHVEVHGCDINVWDDAWQMSGSLYQIDYHHNRHLGAGPSHDSDGSRDPNADPGTVFIHHNLIDTTTYRLFWGRKGRDDEGIREPIPLSTHGVPTVYAEPWKVYYNTVRTGRLAGGVYVGWGISGPRAEHCEAPHEVFNNILLVLDGRPGARDFFAHTGREIYDGNVYWWYRTPSPSRYKSPWRFIHTSRGDIIDQSVQTVTHLRASQAFDDSQAYYAPGWEASGLSVDPELDPEDRPRNVQCQSGAVDLTNTGWPGTEDYQPWRGALRPGGLTHEPALDRRVGSWSRSHRRT